MIYILLLIICAPVSSGYTATGAFIGVTACGWLTPCQNNGSCMDTETGYHCSCPEGFSGRECQHEMTHNKTCDFRHPCEDGEVCMNTTNGYRCESFKKMISLNGEEQCRPYTCLNGGLCMKLAATYKCICPSGYGGANCHRRPFNAIERASLEHEFCERANCTAKLGNGICNLECFFSACHYDGEDCDPAAQPMRIPTVNWTSIHTAAAFLTIGAFLLAMLVLLCHQRKQRQSNKSIKERKERYAAFKTSVSEDDALGELAV